MRGAARRFELILPLDSAREGDLFVDVSLVCVGGTSTQSLLSSAHKVGSQRVRQFKRESERVLNRHTRTAPPSLNRRGGLEGLIKRHEW